MLTIRMATSLPNAAASCLKRRVSRSQTDVLNEGNDPMILTFPFVSSGREIQPGLVCAVNSGAF
jgi:hypothetical protein